MGQAAALFFVTDPEKQTLHRRIVPSEEQLEDQQDRWNTLADHLLSDLCEKSGYSTRTWLQGSYKFGTQIRPVRSDEEFDIDLGFYFVWAGDAGDGQYGPLTLKQMVRDSLTEFANNNEDVIEITEPKTRCERIRYKDSFHIDVPTYHFGDNDVRDLATEKDKWEESDPKAIYIWFKNSFNDTARPKIRRMIRYMKAWAALKFVDVSTRPASILLTVLVAEAAKQIGPDKLGPDDEALFWILAEIVTRIKTEQHVPNPVNEEENLASRLTASQWASLIDKFETFEETADKAMKADDEATAADIWQDAFEYLFPMPELANEVVKSDQNLPAVIYMPEVTVSAVAENNSHLKYSGMNSIGPIPRNCSIEFRITNEDRLPAGAQVFWMVRNEGREAENKNDLGHFRGTGLTAVEQSAYRGRHYMDCTVKQYGTTIAVRRIPVEITGAEAPRRNPPRRARYWAKFRR